MKKRFISIYDLAPDEVTCYYDFDPGHKHGRLFSGYVLLPEHTAKRYAKQYHRKYYAVQNKNGAWMRYKSDAIILPFRKPKL